MLSFAALLISFCLNGIPKDCPLWDRQYKVPPINGPKEISKDPLPKREKP